ncbi:4-hydroxy-3-methylbut-2-en-1-yl diphosphate synthase [Oleiharenicola lentus]|jgi:(E)-4-hydroxy-3-methylbut-2-enyl-diphosphate synthase|uniref:4-hydroxy-3-methylbut-2-en-1-yl diphosphate synthase (flavodoxin) n=1 Tax=Oleiharenicola lentus TaxID=2508720 RepID=A0A4Q1C9F7_9BACT|nr:(E)-4-hydroxy-3-methylbut-2-enyl-diphosphate synthase [Oleiharenicola lentus]RXK55643.1 4-hydroxy-3-methylbut-2-en-1-yl diphosphate synthase [Oleiharenicola lentus]
MSYCSSRFQTVRRRTVEVKVGGVGVGADHPVRVQSMTTSDTQDVAATVKQSIALAEVGCEIVRITAPNVQAAKCLKDIRAQFSAAGFGHIPLVADIHFLPSAAMEAVEHVEKIRVNPGNYADKKKFAVKEYTDADYDEELQRIHDAFSPLVKRAKELGRAMRIGTNHGSLSDRIMNRYGDTPLGMVESALEFLRIARSHSYHDIILSMKSSNPKVMIQAYRLLVSRMAQEDMHYPLHLGVTEAGDGEDGRIKSAIGIGSLLLDGLGDTIRVSLTEDSVYEIPVAQAIAAKAMSLWRESDPQVSGFRSQVSDSIDPYHFTRREPAVLKLSERCLVGPEQPPRVIVRVASLDQLPEAAQALAAPKLKDTPAEGLLVPVATPGDLATLCETAAKTALPVDFLALEIAPSLSPEVLQPLLALVKGRMMLVRKFAATDTEAFAAFTDLVRRHGQFLAAEIAPVDLPAFEPLLRASGDAGLVFTLSSSAAAGHAIGDYRQLVEALKTAGSRAPLWIRNTAATAVRGDNSFLSKLLEASFLTGSLLCDGVGDLVSIETETDVARATKLTYNVLQGAGARISKTEFVACPSCGRTLFDLQTTTQRIRAQTGHLKGVKIAIMGCIVNGPGEMADADFGYVGGAPGKINLYVGKNCVQYNIPQAEADARLIALIREHGKWVDPEPHQLANA